jgi:hypothetical protein
MVASFNLMQFGSAQLSESPDHPNVMKFKGTLVRLDEPSTRAPNGSEGHRILVPSSVARQRLGTLKNMGLNYSPTLAGHAQRRKVGTITRAWIDGKDLNVEGVVWKHDFPEAKKDLKQQGLGMSMELGEVSVEDPHAKVWKLNDFCFLGATVLWKDKAAYYRTAAIAAKADERSDKMAAKAAVKQEAVKQEFDYTKVVQLTAAAVLDGLKPTLGKLSRAIGQTAARLDQLDLEVIAGSNATVEAGKMECTCGGKGTCNACMHAATAVDAKGKPPADDEEDDGDEDDGEMESALADMGPSTSDDEGEDDLPGQLNKGATNKGDKTTTEEKIGKTVDEGVTGARLEAALKSNKKLAAQVAQLQATVGQLQASMKNTKKQITAATEKQGRRTIAATNDPMLDGILAKGGLPGSRELRASGQILTTDEADAVITAALGPDAAPVDRMAAKNRLLQEGLMEQGYVQR